MTIAERALAEQRYKFKLLHREVSRNLEEAAVRILGFEDNYPNMEESSREAFIELLKTALQRLADVESKLSGGRTER